MPSLADGRDEFPNIGGVDGEVEVISALERTDHDSQEIPGFVQQRASARTWRDRSRELYVFYAPRDIDKIPFPDGPTGVDLGPRLAALNFESIYERLDHCCTLSEQTMGEAWGPDLNDCLHAARQEADGWSLGVTALITNGKDDISLRMAHEGMAQLCASYRDELVRASMRLRRLAATPTEATDTKPKMTPEERSSKAWRYLNDRPDATARELAGHLGVAVGTAVKLPAWKEAMSRRRNAERRQRERKPVRKGAKAQARRTREQQEEAELLETYREHKADLAAQENGQIRYADRTGDVPYTENEPDDSWD